MFASARTVSHCADSAHVMTELIEAGIPNYGANSSNDHKPTEPPRPSSSAKRSAATSTQP